MSAPTETSAGVTAIRPFTIPVTPEAELQALRTRVAATRWPDQELVKDHSQGPKLAVMQELARYWATDYDWRACEARLNALPQFTTEIDGTATTRSPAPSSTASPRAISPGTRSSTTSRCTG